MVLADPTGDCLSGRLGDTDEIDMTRPSNPLLDGVLPPSPEHGQFTLATFGNPYFDSSSYSSWETSIAMSLQAEVGPGISLRYDDASSVLTSAHTQLNAQSASFVTRAQPIPNMALPPITPQTGAHFPSPYSQPPPTLLPINPWLTQWAQSQAMTMGTTHGSASTQFGILNPTLQALGAQPRFPGDEFTVGKMAPGPDVADTTAAAKSAKRGRHRRPQSLNLDQTDQTECKGFPRGIGIHRPSRLFSSCAPKPTKPSIPGQFVFPVERPQTIGSRSASGLEDPDYDTLSLRSTYLIRDSHESHNSSSGRGSTSTIAAPSSHTLSGPVTPASSSWTMSPAQADLYKSRARNRVSAGRCRVKHRASVARLKANDREVTEEREKLEETVSLLRYEVFSLKEELLKHAGCDCAMIREYLALEAKRYCRGSPPGFISCPLQSVRRRNCSAGKVGVDGNIPA